MHLFSLVKKSALPNLLVTTVAMGVAACSDSGKINESSLPLDPRLEQAVLLDNIPETARTNLKIDEANTGSSNSVLAVELVQHPGTDAFKISISDDAEDHMVIFNDIGIAGDATGNDGVYSTVIDNEDITGDLIQVLESQSGQSMPVFKDRAQSGYTQYSQKAKGDFAVSGPVTGNPDNIDVFRELMITDVSVVEDPQRTYDPCTKQGTPNGEWTFARLIRDIANQDRTGITPEEFAQTWVDQILNSAPASLESEVLNDWIFESGGADQPLDLDKAPFKLLAIVNRIDLRTKRDAGEVRFAFGAVRTARCEFVTAAGPAPYSVIFEYKKKGRSHGIRKKWGRQWHKLANFELGSAEYNRELAKLTRKVTKAGINRKQQPNRTALSQLRTNAEVSEGKLWQLRQFEMAANSNQLMRGHLETSTVTTTPSEGFNKTDALSKYMNNNARKIAKNKHKIPQFMETTASLAQTGFTLDEFFWEGSAAIPVDPETRHLFALNTCNGCHGRETNTQFVHIDPERPEGMAAGLSGFLTGRDVADPTDPSTIRRFNELERRAQDLDALINLPRSVQAFRKKPSQAH